MSACKTKNAMNFSKKVNKYTTEGRKLIHKSIDKVSDFEFIYLTKNPVINRSIEYNDNRISLFSAQSGKCGVLGERLEINDFHCHHIIPGVHRKLARSVLGGVIGKVLSSDSNSLVAYSTSCTVWSRGKGGDCIKALPIAIYKRATAQRFSTTGY